MGIDQTISDNESWRRSLKNKALEEAFNVQPGGKPLPVKQVFKKEEEKETTRKIKDLEKRIDLLEKQNKILIRDNMIFKRKLKNITDRNINESTDSEK